MPSYKLIYFNVRARGETARMLFKLAGVDFVDHRVTWDTPEWEELKKSEWLSHYSKCPLHRKPMEVMEPNEHTEGKSSYIFGCEWYNSLGFGGK